MAARKLVVGLIYWLFLGSCPGDRRGGRATDDFCASSVGRQSTRCATFRSAWSRARCRWFLADLKARLIGVHPLQYACNLFGRIARPQKARLTCPTVAHPSPSAMGVLPFSLSHRLATAQAVSGGVGIELPPRQC